MAKKTYKLWIKGRGRGLRSSTVKASSMAEVKKMCSVLEAGTDVTVQRDGATLGQFTVR